MRVHMGRAWTGHAVEDECPCDKAPCGLAMSAPGVVCDQHNPADWRAAKTMRQLHLEDQCPGAPAGDISPAEVPEPSGLEMSRAAIRSAFITPRPILPVRA